MGVDGDIAWMVAAAAAAAVVASYLFNAAVRLVWRPRAIAAELRAQGVRGPGYRFYHGTLGEIKRLRAAASGAVLDVDSHDYLPLVHPHFRKWIPLYGRVFLMWFGPTPEICVADLAVAKQVLSDRTGAFPKNRMNPSMLRLFGEGLLLTNGDVWQRHRKVVHPAFNTDKLKLMAETMADCALLMVSRWEARLGKKGDNFQVEIDLSSQFEELTADVISRTAFGSSYREGRQVFQALNELQFIAFSAGLNVHIPALRYVPNRKNMRSWRLDRTVRSTLMKMIKKRLAAVAAEKSSGGVGGYGDDLLGLMLEACASPEEHGGEKQVLSMEEIVDECKTFFFAGQETTSHLLSWVMFLLGTHPEWQEKLREEVVEHCGREEVPRHDALGKLKQLNLFLLETLRVYSPVPQIRRRARAAVELGGGGGGFTVPEGAILTIPIATIHRDRDVWGEDADEFDPLRFDSAAGAGRVNALLSFSAGPRACIGQNFAMVEARSAVAMILQRFALSLSPAYVHAPADVITLRPKHGLPMMVRRADHA